MCQGIVVGAVKTCVPQREFARRRFCCNSWIARPASKSESGECDNYSEQTNLLHGGNRGYRRAISNGTKAETPSSVHRVHVLDTTGRGSRPARYNRPSAAIAMGRCNGMPVGIQTRSVPLSPEPAFRVQEIYAPHASSILLYLWQINFDPTQWQPELSESQYRPLPALMLLMRPKILPCQPTNLRCVHYISSMSLENLTDMQSSGSSVLLE